MLKADIKQKIFLLSSRPLLKQAPPRACPDEIFFLVADHQGCGHARPAIEGGQNLTAGPGRSFNPKGFVRPILPFGGRRVMEVMRDRGIDLGATCGAACAGCHVCLDRPSRERLHLMSPGLSGLGVGLASGSDLE
jgi:hypothetical protein